MPGAIKCGVTDRRAGRFEIRPTAPGVGLLSVRLVSRGRSPELFGQQRRVSVLLQIRTVHEAVAAVPRQESINMDQPP